MTCLFYCNLYMPRNYRSNNNINRSYPLSKKGRQTTPRTCKIDFYDYSTKGQQCYNASAIKSNLYYFIVSTQSNATIFIYYFFILDLASCLVCCLSWLHTVIPNAADIVAPQYGRMLVDNYLLTRSHIVWLIIYYLLIRSQLVWLIVYYLLFRPQLD